AVDEGEGKLFSFLPPKIFQKLQITEVPSRELMLLEAASLQNQKLKAALNPSQALQKTSLASEELPGWKVRAGWEGRGTLWCLRDPLLHAVCAGGRGLWANVPNTLPALQMLSLQQHMVENLVIAKAREETVSFLPVLGSALQQKMEEQWLQLQEAANGRFSSSIALSPEEQEQRSLYTAILKYEQDHDCLRQWKSRLKRSPADLSLLSGLFCLLRYFLEHPIVQLLQQLQCAVYTRLYPAITWGAADNTVASPTGLSFLLLGPRGLGRWHGAVGPQHNLSSTPLAAGPSTPMVEGSWPEPAAASQTPWESSFEDLEQFLASPEGWAPRKPLAGLRTEVMLLEQLRGIVWDIQDAIDRLLSLMLLAFKRLNTATSKDQCPACLEEAFFPPLWALLLALYSFAIEDLRLIPLETYPCRKLKCIESSILYCSAGLTHGSFLKGEHTHYLLAAAVYLAYSCIFTVFSSKMIYKFMRFQECPSAELAVVRPLCSIYKCAKEYCGAWDRQISTSAAIHHDLVGCWGVWMWGWVVLLLPELMVPISSSRVDNLLPILSYVVLQTGLPQLLAECAALEELIYEGYLTGEKGYCLTSLQSTLSYMESLQ
ncbi:LOW QUALITY PROTEIN: VPS9 domain-containing protein 1-like, partial [Guaruba guarouba]